VRSYSFRARLPIAPVYLSFELSSESSALGTLEAHHTIFSHDFCFLRFAYSHVLQEILRCSLFKNSGFSLNVFFLIALVMMLLLYSHHEP